MLRYCLASAILIIFLQYSLCVSSNDGFQPSVIQIDKLNEISNIQITTNRSFIVQGNDFLLDGKPFQIISGSLHYFRVPAAYWRDRLEKLKAAGLNSVSTYIEWSFHESEEREYDFKGDRDIAQFIRTAGEVGLFVLLRPGPYICAERDLGGFPYWLLGKYPNIKLRTLDKDFMNECSIWLEKFFSQVTPLLYGNGGPIIMVQVENEYGSFFNDHKYMASMRDLMLQHVGDKALLYTTDGKFQYMIKNGRIDGTVTTIDFGPEPNLNTVIDSFRQVVSVGPFMNSEFYPGWLTHWGENMARVGTERVIKTLKDMLDVKANLNFYVFFGGTNFEFTNGANFNNHYQPDITSYDYDAPLTESGDYTPKYYAIRKTLIEYFPDVIQIPLPQESFKGNYGEVTLHPKLKLLSNDGRNKLGKKYKNVQGERLPYFEDLRQRSGMVLYEIAIETPLANSTLRIPSPGDYIYVFVDQVYQGTIRRMDNQFSLQINGSSLLSLLVESQGRLNYGTLLEDKKGIGSLVFINDKPLKGNWSITGYPLQSFTYTPEDDVQINENVEPVLYRGSFILPSLIGDHSVPKETFVDPTDWGRGYIWINGHNLGRYWPSKGPQVTLYCPGVWLTAKGENIIEVLELEAASPNKTMQFIHHPIVKKRTTIKPTR